MTDTQQEQQQEKLDKNSEVKTLWERTDAETKSLLSEVLEDKDTIFKAKVLNLVVKHGLSANDPLFLILIAIGSMEISLEEAPAAIALSVEKIRSQQEKAAREAIALNQSLIAASVKELINKTEALQLRRPFKVLIPGMALFAVVFALGAIVGVAIGGIFGGQLANAVNIDSWASSEERQYAKNLYEWNKDYLKDGNCQKDVARSRSKAKLQMTWGKKTSTSGFCVLWVVPPGQR